MKVPLRIVLPILAAVVVAGSVLALISWQLQSTAERLRRNPADVTGDDIGLQDTGPIDAEGDDVLLHLRQGDLAALAGDWKVAETEYGSAVSLGGGIPALRKLAQAQMQRRDTDAAKKTIQRLQDAGARDEDLLLLRVLVNLRSGDLDGARQLLDGAADSPHKQYAEALLLLIRGQHPQARTTLQAVVAGWDPALRSYARTLDTAYEEFALFPEGQSIHLTTLLARALAQVQECELALPMLADVIGKQPDYRDAWIVQGYCQLTTERAQEALASFEEAYGLDPEKPEIQYFLGRAHAALGDQQNAITYLQYAMENGFEPQKEVRLRLAQAALEAGNAEQALEQYVAILDLTDAEPAALEKVISLSISLGKKDDAYARAVAAADRWPESAKVQEMLGWAAQETGKAEEARAAYLKALDLDPALQSARDRLGKL